MNDEPRRRRIVNVHARVAPKSSAWSGLLLLMLVVTFAYGLTEANPLLLGAGASAAAAILGFLSVQTNRRLRRVTQQAEEDPGARLRRRIQRVNAALAEASSLMGELQRDLAAQQAAREELIAQAEEQQRLLAIDQEQAENIRQIIVGETKETIRAERRQQWMFFALGILVSIPIGVAINLLVP